MFKWFKKKQAKKDIRPMSLQDFTGQENTKLVLGVALNGAKQRRTGLEHVVIYGSPGLGKTTLSTIIASEMKATMHTSIGTALQKQSDILELFEDIFDGDIIFIDEIHRLPIRVEELLYTAMEDNYIETTSGRIKVPRFTLIGATTKLGDLSEPMRDRFGIQLRLDYYSVEELMTIAMRTVGVLDNTITPDAARVLAMVARGTPRILNSYIRRSIDVALAHGTDVINETAARAALTMLEIDEYGLDRMDRIILDVMITDYKCNPVGLNTLAVSVGESAKTIQEVYEPYLIMSKMILPTSRGRTVTQKAIKHMEGCR